MLPAIGVCAECCLPSVCVRLLPTLGVCAECCPPSVRAERSPPSPLPQNRGGGLDMRVQEAWAAGVTGKGIVATILDDGLEKGHPDIIKNYVSGKVFEFLFIATSV